MNYAIDIINFSAAISGLIIAIMGLVFTLSLSYLEQWLHRYFVILFSLVLAYVAFDLLGQISLVFLGPDFATLSRISIFRRSRISKTL